MRKEHKIVLRCDLLENLVVPNKILSVLKAAVSFSDEETGFNIMASQNTISKKANKSLRTTKRTMKLIEEIGLLVKTKDYNHNSYMPEANIYMVNMPLLEALIQDSEEIRAKRYAREQRNVRIRERRIAQTIDEARERLRRIPRHKNNLGAWCQNGPRCQNELSMVSKYPPHGVDLTYNLNTIINTGEKPQSVDKSVSKISSSYFGIDTNLETDDDLKQRALNYSLIGLPIPLALRQQMASRGIQLDPKTVLGDKNNLNIPDRLAA